MATDSPQRPVLDPIAAFFCAILGVLIALLICVALEGCSPRVVYRDVEKIEYRDRIVHDTATIEIPREVEKIVTRDTSSVIENTYAKSEAVVSGGFLSHTLESKPKIIRVPVEVVVHDTTYIKETTEQKTEYVEKELTWWQSFRMKAAPWLFILLVLALLWIFRKSIVKLIKPRV